MNPEEATDTLVVRACGHLVGNLESILKVPWAGLNDTENNEIFRLNIVKVRLVGDAKSTTSSILEVVSVNSCGRLPRAA